jgi:hypothetical protein
MIILFYFFYFNYFTPPIETPLFVICQGNVYMVEGEFHTFYVNGLNLAT